MDVAVKGNYAFGTFGIEGGFRIIDISNPSAPLLVGVISTLSDASSVTVAGDYAYIGDGSGLHILNISDPTAPYEVGSYPGYVGEIVLVGNTAFAASWDSGLVILRLLSDKVTGTIPVTGGSLTSKDGNTVLTFASGAFTQTVDLTYQQFLYPEALADRVEVGRTFELTAVYSDTGKTADLAPGQTFSLTIAYSDTQPGPSIENTLAIYQWDGYAWVREPTSSVDTVHHIITATPNHLSRWAVFGETRWVLLPIIGR